MPNNVRHGQSLPDITRSRALLQRAERLIPSQTQTLAKGPGQFSRGVCPVYVDHGAGARVWDVDGNEFLDYSMGVGPLSLGYCYPAVDEAIRVQLGKGITFSLMHPLELEVAELLHSVIPNAEMVRFSKTGADVTSAAVRLARAYTGKSRVVCCGYHGWHDWYISVTDRCAGIPDAVREETFAYNDIESVVDAVDGDTACVILEPMVFEEPKENFLRDLRNLCTEHNIVLVFDEMWTGFRLALGGAQEYFGVNADLATFSKAMANGMPVSALTGRGDIMKLLEKDVFFYTTFGGEALSLAAVKATVEELRRCNVPADLRRKGQHLQSNLNVILGMRGLSFLKCVGAPARTMLQISQNSLGTPLEVKTFIQQQFLCHGILWNGFQNLSYSHTDDDIDYTIKAYADIADQLSAIQQQGSQLRDHLKGSTLEPVFRKTSNFNTKPKLAAV
jgi:glutamate-1-semialdehyde aminotransferase